MSKNQKSIEQVKSEIKKLIHHLDDKDKQIALLESSIEFGSKEWADKVSDLMKRMGMIKKKDS